MSADRHDGRRSDEMREVQVAHGFTEMAAGSVLISVGKTRVLCTVSFDDRVPPWMRGSSKGWISAEYSLLPGSSPERVSREAVRGKQSGRTVEIQRLIGRSLRSCVNLSRLGECQLLIDCDVLQADGGTRTAAITGSYLALRDALTSLHESGKVPADVLVGSLAAVSVGVIESGPVLDLDYFEDSRALVDLNLVMTGSGEFVEIQGTAEGQPFSQQELQEMLRLGELGISQLLTLPS